MVDMFSHQLSKILMQKIFFYHFGIISYRFIKRAEGEGSFNKFHMKLSPMKDTLFSILWRCGLKSGAYLRHFIDYAVLGGGGGGWLLHLYGSEAL